MKEFEDWDMEDITFLYKIIDMAHKAKNASKLSQILDEINDLRELLGSIDIKKIGDLLKKLVDIMVDRTEGIKKDLGDQENT